MKKTALSISAIFSSLLLIITFFAAASCSCAHTTHAPKKKHDYLHFEQRQSAPDLSTNVEFLYPPEKENEKIKQLFVKPNGITFNFTYNLG